MTSPEVDGLLAAAHDVGRKQLTWGTAGNISARLEGQRFLMSASGAELATLDEGQLVVVHLDDKSHARDHRASFETPMHGAIYAARSDVRCVVHASPFYATLVSCTTLDVDASLTVDASFYIRQVGRVPFEPPGSESLARVASGMAVTYNALLLSNHGAVTLGADPHDAVRRLECLEMLCRMVTYGALGIPLMSLEPGQVEAVLAAVAAERTA